MEAKIGSYFKKYLRVIYKVKYQVALTNFYSTIKLIKIIFVEITYGITYSFT